MPYNEFVQSVEENKFRLKNCLAYSLMLEPHTKENLFDRIQKEEQKHFGEIRLFKRMSTLDAHIKYTLEHQKYLAAICIDSKKKLWQLVEKGKTGSIPEVKLKKREQAAYIPTKSDCEKAIEELKRIKSTNKINADEVLNYLESHFKDKYSLHDNWREITRANFKSWFT